MIGTNPLVSVIMPAYRCADTVEESVASVRNQTWNNWELLIVEDGSPDNTIEVLEKLERSDPRIHIYCTGGNAGPAAARNLALDHAGGAYAAFLDSDDMWMPEKLERQLEFMRQTGAEFSCTAYDRISEDGAQTLGRVTPFEKADYRKVLYYANPVGNSTAMYSLERLGDIRVPNIRKRNDFALWLAVLKRTDYVYGMAECLGKYRVKTSSVSSDKWGLVRYQWELYRKVENLSLPQTVGAFAGLAYTQVFRPTWKTR